VIGATMVPMPAPVVSQGCAGGTPQRRSGEQGTHLHRLGAGEPGGSDWGCLGGRRKGEGEGEGGGEERRRERGGPRVGEGPIRTARMGEGQPGRPPVHLLRQCKKLRASCPLCAHWGWGGGQGAGEGWRGGGGRSGEG